MITAVRRAVVRCAGHAAPTGHAPARPIGAWASPQSEPIADRSELDDRVREIEQRFAGGAVQRPAHWGGYLLRPDEVEFWQGQVGRLHDRFRYTREAAGWRIERLAP